MFLPRHLFFMSPPTSLCVCVHASFPPPQEASQTKRIMTILYSYCSLHVSKFPFVVNGSPQLFQVCKKNFSKKATNQSLIFERERKERKKESFLPFKASCTCSVKLIVSFCCRHFPFISLMIFAFLELSGALSMTVNMKPPITQK